MLWATENLGWRGKQVTKSQLNIKLHQGQKYQVRLRLHKNNIIKIFCLSKESYMILVKMAVQ